MSDKVSFEAFDTTSKKKVRITFHKKTKEQLIKEKRKRIKELEKEIEELEVKK